MAKMLDLTRNRREYLPIKLDEVGIVNVATPEKHVYDELMDYAPELGNLTSDNPEDVKSATEGMYSICAMLLSNNKEGRQFSKDEVVELLDVMTAVSFLRGYSDFVAEAKAGREKN